MNLNSFEPPRTAAVEETSTIFSHSISPRAPFHLLYPLSQGCLHLLLPFPTPYSSNIYTLVLCWLPPLACSFLLHLFLILPDFVPLYFHALPTLEGTLPLLPGSITNGCRIDTHPDFSRATHLTPPPPHHTEHSHNNPWCHCRSRCQGELQPELHWALEFSPRSFLSAPLLAQPSLQHNLTNSKSK